MMGGDCVLGEGEEFGSMVLDAVEGNDVEAECVRDATGVGAV